MSIMRKRLLQKRDDFCVLTKAYGFSETSIIIVFYGGEDFHVDSIKVTGWKPLGREFHVTKSQGSLLQELDGILAYDVYHKYLNIKNDENFFYNTLEFPLFYEHNDTTILRTPVSSNAFFPVRQGVPFGSTRSRPMRSSPSTTYRPPVGFSHTGNFCARRAV